ncbi:hypothetical protein Tco_0442272 [Tanacetum coccineum]
MKYLRSENAQNLDKLSMLRAVAASAKDSRHKLSKELDELHLSVKEVDCLGQRCPDLEAERDFLQKAISHGRSHDLDELEFPYISLLIEKVGQRLGKLAVVDSPVTQEATFS